MIFRVPDVDAFARTLAAHRVPVLRPPTDRPAWSLRTLHLRDPEGHLVEICSDLPRH